jgi:hypothetical protein
MRKRTIYYIIVAVPSLEPSATTNLANEVNEQIILGYRPVGQPFVHGSSLCQAMMIHRVFPNGLPTTT